MRIYYSIRFLVYTAIAIAIGMYSRQLLDYLHYLVGGVMLIFGVEEMIIPLVKDPKKIITNVHFYLGHIDFILGVVLLTSIRNFEYICVLWATWTIVREAFDLYEIGHKALHGFPAVLSLALSITEIVFSVLLLIFVGEHHALTHIYLLIPEFIITGISPLLFELFNVKRKKRKAQKQEAQENK